MSYDRAYFDLQVNGYAGVDFNSDDLTQEAMHGACERLRADGVRGILATVITDDIEVMQERLERIADCCEASSFIRSVVAGVHVEGPFVSDEPGYVGAHPAKATMAADVGVAQRLIDASGGLVRLMTLAPERDPSCALIKSLVAQGICVSAGHCDPSLEQLNRAIDAGLSMFTHLGNGCPLQMHRHENVIQRVLSLADRLWICFIADGVHVPFEALKNYLAVVGPDRAIVVTDAIAAAGMGPGRFTLGGQDVIVDERLATWAADRSHLVGSAATMNQVVQNLRESLDLDEQMVEKLTRINPLAALAAE